MVLKKICFNVANNKIWTVILGIILLFSRWWVYRRLLQTLAYPRSVPGGILAVSATVGAEQLLGCTPAKELVTNDCSVTFILHFSVYSRGIRLLHSTYISTLTADARISWIEIYLTSYTWDLTRHLQISCSVLIIIDNWIYICWWRTIDYWNTATVR